MTDFKQVSWTLSAIGQTYSPTPRLIPLVEPIKMNKKMIHINFKKEEIIERGSRKKPVEHQHKNIIRHECRCRWCRMNQCAFSFKRSNLSVPLTQHAICCWTLLWWKREKHEKELKQRMRDDSLRGEDEHIRQELPGNNWVTLWWSATITFKCSRRRQSNQSNLINIKTLVVFWRTRMRVIVWQWWCYLTCHLPWMKTK